MHPWIALSEPCSKLLHLAKLSITLHPRNDGVFLMLIYALAKGQFGRKTNAGHPCETNAGHPCDTQLNQRPISLKNAFMAKDSRYGWYGWYGCYGCYG